MTLCQLSMLLLMYIIVVLCTVKVEANRSSSTDMSLINKSSSEQNKSLYKRLDTMKGESMKDTINNTLQQSTEWSPSRSCPPWFYYSNTEHECRCGPTPHKIIRCNDTLQTSEVLDCYCVTFDEHSNRTVVGACSYNCGNHEFKEATDLIYRRLPKHTSEITTYMCDHLKRTGPLCGQCMDGYYPPVYSYSLNCVKCPNGNRDWWKFILAAFLPLTFFYFIILFFKITATSSHLHAYVLFSQAFSMPAFVRVISVAVPKNFTLLVNTTIALYGFWNLDFFRTLLPTICLQTTTLKALALDYAIAVYPLFLMIVTYILIELHENNFKIIVKVWKPFRILLAFFRRNWDSRTSVIDAYATFFLLSFIKFLSTSFDLLIPTTLYDLNCNETTSKLVLYYDGSIEYLGKEHLPYAIVAISILLFFIVLPIALLLLFPFAFFQNLLDCFPDRLRHNLRTFVEAFQGCYKDGTEPGTRDCRCFAVLFLLGRIILFLIYSVSLGSAYFPMANIALSLAVILMVIVQPFKAQFAHHTKLNAAFVLLITLLYTSTDGIGIATIKAETFILIYDVAFGLVGMFPLFYISCVVIYWLISQRKWGTKIWRRIRAWRKGYYTLTPNYSDTGDAYPDDTINSGRYQYRL